jgi:hypothetical protein
MNQTLAILVAWTPLLGCGAPPGGEIEIDRQALTTSYSSPFGTAPLQVVVGTWPPKNAPFLVYRKLATSECQFTQLDAFSDVVGIHNINLGPGSDLATIVAPGTSARIDCSPATGGTVFFTAPLQRAPSWLFGVSEIHIYGGAGNDTIFCSNFSPPGTNNANTCLGQDGNDYLYASNTENVFIWGGPGDDKLVSATSGPGLYMFGEGGNDCLQAGSGPAPGAYDCGDGASDRSVGPLGPHCELSTSTCAGD